MIGMHDEDSTDLGERVKLTRVTLVETSGV